MSLWRSHAAKAVRRNGAGGGWGSSVVQPFRAGRVRARSTRAAIGDGRDVPAPGLPRAEIAGMMPLHMAAPARTRAHAPRRRAPGIIRALAVIAVSASAVLRIAIPARADVAPGAPATAAGDLVRAELISDAAAISPGSTFRLAVRLTMREGWHVNWLNPGDAGLAPGIAWKLPPGFRAGLLAWPMPDRFRSGPLVIFGYGGDVVLATEVRVPKELPPGGAVELAADVSWLACEEACIPGSAAASLRLPVEPAPRRNATSGAMIEAALARCPSPSLQWNVQARIEDGDRLVLDLQTAAAATPRIENVFFFPFDQGIIENASAQALSASAGPYDRTAYQLRIELSRVGGARPSRLAGVLVSASGWNGDGKPGAIEIDIPVSPR